MAPRVALASLCAAALATPGLASGLSICPCIDVTAQLNAAGYLVNGQYRTQYPGSSQTFSFPTTYGSSTCAAHDDQLAPLCNRATPPTWCAMQWCYVDPNNCGNSNNAVTKMGSRIFTRVANLHFSYQTCEQAASGGGSSTPWRGGSAATWSSASADEGKELIQTVERYVRSTRHLLEDVFTNHANNSASCTYADMCNCPTCTSWSGWPSVDFEKIGTKIGPPGVSQKAVCMSDSAADSMARIASAESDPDRARVGFQYFADQASGTYTQWPAQTWSPACTNPATYEPRFRDWYAAGTTGPKDVLIVVDVSGSMQTASRHILAKRAAKAILDVLTWKDFATIILFNSGISARYSTMLKPVTESERSAMKTWIDNGIWAQGGTNFVAAFDDAFSVTERSVGAGQTSMCQKAILFLTDGEDTAFQDSHMNEIQRKATDYDTYIFTYALGSGANTVNMKRVACENRGVFYPVPDGADLAQIMSSFYEFFAQGQEMCSASWVKYTATGGSNAVLYAGCMAMYNRTRPDAGLLGVTCMDANLIKDPSQLRQDPTWGHFVCQASDVTKQCRAIDQTDCHRQKVRLAYSSESVCSDQETVTADTTCRCTDVNCQDDVSFIDEKSYFCDTWVGENCNEAASRWGYTATGQAAVLQNCRRSCGLCPTLTAAQCEGARPSPLECTVLSIPSTCRACRGVVSGVDIDGNAMAGSATICGPSWAPPTTTTAAGDVVGSANSCSPLQATALAAVLLAIGLPRQ